MTVDQLTRALRKAQGPEEVLVLDEDSNVYRLCDVKEVEGEDGELCLLIKFLGGPTDPS
jgi:hypothetical protein